MKYYPYFWDGHNKKLDHPITLAQTALDEYNKGNYKLFKQLALKLKKIKPLNSGMFYGLTLSVFTRMRWWKECYKILDRFEPIEDRGFIHITNKYFGLEYWYEEYPEKRNHVLNGHIYTLLGLHNFIKAKKDPVTKFLFNKGLTSLVRNIHKYDLNLIFFRWSKYDLKGLFYSGVRYHNNVHIPQLMELYKIQPSKKILKYINKWTDYSRKYYNTAQILDQITQPKTKVLVSR